MSFASGLEALALRQGFLRFVTGGFRPWNPIVLLRRALFWMRVRREAGRTGAEEGESDP